jgi:hypothetical protein
MKVYLVIIEDRHIDVQVEVYATAEAALERAREVVDEYGFMPEGPEGLLPNWLFNATLSVEGDCVRVEEAEVRP